MIAWLRAIACELFGHRFAYRRRLVRDEPYYVCERCGVES